jgi:hypothetical protein
VGPSITTTASAIGSGVEEDCITSANEAVVFFGRYHCHLQPEIIFIFKKNNSSK